MCDDLASFRLHHYKSHHRSSSCHYKQQGFSETQKYYFFENLSPIPDNETQNATLFERMSKGKPKFYYFCQSYIEDPMCIKPFATISKVLFLLTAALLTASHLQAQSPCEISCNATLPVCSESAVVLSVPNDYQRTYLWSTGETKNSITVRPYATTNYSVKVMDLSGNEICHSEPFTVEVKPRFNIDFNQIQLTCSNNTAENGQTAQVLAQASGSIEPYTYAWQISPLHIAPNNPALAIGLKAYAPYGVKVTDGRGCVQYDTVYPRGYINAKVKIIADPSDTVYRQNPHVTYSFENKSILGSVPNDSIVEISNFYWILEPSLNLTSTQEKPSFTYIDEGDYTVQLKVFNAQGCDTTYTKNIKVMPVKLKIPNVFTPNGDGINDTFIISLDGGSDDPGNSGTRGGKHEYDRYKPLNTYYQSSDLVIFNRWGRIVYQSNNYQNDWDGGNLPDATYFYVLKCHGQQADATYRGSVAIVGSGR